MFLNNNWVHYSTTYGLDSVDQEQNIPGRVFTLVDNTSSTPTVKAGGDAADGIAGVLVGNPDYYNYGTAGDPFSPLLYVINGTTVSITTTGTFVSQVTNAVNAGDPVYYLIADGSINGNAAGGTVALLPNAKFIKPAAALGFAEIMLNLS
jgi:hypothetical protein